MYVGQHRLSVFRKGFSGYSVILHAIVNVKSWTMPVNSQSEMLTWVCSRDSVIEKKINKMMLSRIVIRIWLLDIF